MPECPRVPKKKAREAISRTNDTGNEHGFVICPNGSTGEIQEGGSSGMKIEDDACSADGAVGLYHTHPNGVLRLSDQDRRVLGRDDTNMVCVGNSDPDDPQAMCERSKPTCTIDLG